ncbi:MAG: isoprenylcysteine carboxylmethyltransferase family protein [Bacillota bacterium]|nr:isoprenylcysteine carboxylmethyltransferase family protein [Bacillota bacterium]
MKHKLDKSGINYLVRVLFQVLIGMALFYISSGRTFAFRGMIYFSLYIILVISGVILLAGRNSEVLNERAKKRDNTKGWDKVLLKLYILLAFFGVYIAAGLDAGRYPKARISFDFIYPGILIYIFSSALSIWAMAENQYFEATSRIQKDRDQVVCSSGPYRFIRHPGYLSILLWCISVPMIFGSVYAMLPVICIFLIIVIRTYLEDNMLKKELPGYIEYSGRVRYRLIPFIF